MGIVIVLLNFAALTLVGIALYMVVDAQQMSDEDREDLGLGPKGQGR